MKAKTLGIIFLFYSTVISLTAGQQSVSQFLSWYNTTAGQNLYKDTVANWIYNTNVTKYNQDKAAQADAAYAVFKTQAAQNASTINLNHVTDASQLRRMNAIKTVGIKLNKTENIQLSTLVGEMSSVYAKGSICGWINHAIDCTVKWKLDPNIFDFLSNSTDAEGLEYVWNAWRNVTKGNIQYYKQFVPLINKGARAGGYADAGDWWRSWYESKNFTAEVQQLYYQILPLYEELHTYVRKQLRRLYGTKIPELNSINTIQAHLTGNMWAQEWQNLYNSMIPFPGESKIDVTAEMNAQGYTPIKMFHTADDFFQSLGLIPMPQAFWDKSIITRPKDRDFVCHASAWDFYNNHDYRIKMCTNVDMNDLVTIHHEMGHIQYYLQYTHQPVSFKDGANPGFHEAIGDTMALSVSTPKHLQAIGLLKNYKPNEHQTINYQFRTALEKIAFLPFGYLMDNWRWMVFNGSSTPDQWNNDWWHLRYQLQGLSPPNKRGSGAFDPAAKSHIDSNTPYIRYFVSFIIQFQFYRAMCADAGYTDPTKLYSCDFYKNKTAGARLAKMLQMGSSKPWPEAMKVMTGQPNMDASAIIQYFSPLMKWLKQQNTGECYGWGYQWPDSVMATLQQKRCSNDVTGFLNTYSKLGSQAYFKDTSAHWNYETNLTDYNSNLVVKADAAFAQFQQSQAQQAANVYINSNISYGQQRQMKKIKTIGITLSNSAQTQFSQIINQMVNIYSTGKVCPLNLNTMQQMCPSNQSQLWTLTDMSNILASSRNYNQLRYVWKSWRDAVGPQLSNLYQQYVTMSNQGAVNGGFQDTGDWWRSWYEDSSFREEIKNLWKEVVPMYVQLHTYVRAQLMKAYPGKFSSSAIPAHILGNMWSQTWTNIYSFTAPYPNKPTIDVTKNMITQKYNASRMFHTADSFFGSLGLIRMPDAFWKRSMIVKPKGREVVCHASAWDFYNAHDYGIKMCTQVTMDDLVVIHHEMGHIEYYLQYSGQPIPFREGANPGFHEAIGDTMALSVSTPQHLKTIGLLPNYIADPEQDINYLYRQALDKIAFLPFAYIVDEWRWQVFNGTLTNRTWNNGWWKLRTKYQGIVPPVSRSSNDFDPGAKYHIPNNMPYVRYFVSYILQFQFYEALCNASGHKGPLHTCDFYNSTAAGQKLASMLKLGSSLPWKDALKQITGKDSMSAQSIKNYFQPLINWLKIQNQGQCFGWGYNWTQSYNWTQCGDNLPSATKGAQNWLVSYNKQASVVYNRRVSTDWTWEKNITKFNENIRNAAATASNLFDVKEAAIASRFDLNTITDYGAARQLKKIKAVQIKLDLNDTQNFNKLITTMTNVFSTAYICNPAFPNCTQTKNSAGKWVRDPTLTNLVANSSDYNLLSYIWKAWRDMTGKKVLPYYKQYVTLGNKGAKQAGYLDLGDAWRQTYEDPTFKQDLENLWQQILPLYEEIHAYVRTQLSQNVYPGKFNTSAIPAHILGNMWAQAWNNIYDRTVPYPKVSTIDVTSEMKKQGYTPKIMFLKAQSFFASLGMYNMTPSFWKLSLIQHPANRTNVVCYASAEDFYNGKDFGIKMCTKVTMEDLVTIHHEMGHVEYFMAYSKQPIKFRDSANAGFHEAIGDTIALSVSTPGHLNKIGLLPNSSYEPNNKKQRINFLYKQALEKIAFLPFGYLIDNYRWKVFDGTIPMNELNSGWWDLRYKYQGLVPPVKRTNSDFDAGAKFHVDNNVPYIRYFVSFVVQFQFHKALCQAAGQKVPLDQCDIYQSTAAGQRLLSMLKLGSSKPWPYAMSVITNNATSKMDASALMEYFSPLLNYLRKVNQQNNACYGWGYTWPSSYNLRTNRCPIQFATPTSAPKPPPQPPKGTENSSSYNTFLIVAIVLSALCLAAIIVAIAFLFVLMRNKKDHRSVGSNNTFKMGDN